jgi:hypothetical protein
MNNYRVEYLAIFDEKDSFCKDTNAINKLLQTIDGIELIQNNIKYKSIEIKYEIKFKILEDNKHRFFHFIFICNEENKIDIFNNLLHKIKSILNRNLDKNIQILWDDISLLLCGKSISYNK